MAGFTDNENAYDNLVVGGFPATTQREILITGQDVVRGEALGKITASGKVTTWGTGGSNDGHRTFYGLAAEAVDATAADKSIAVYKTGKFMKDQIVISGEASADDIEDIMEPARDYGIVIVDDTTVQN